MATIGERNPEASQEHLSRAMEDLAFLRRQVAHLNDHLDVRRQHLNLKDAKISRLEFRVRKLEIELSEARKENRALLEQVTALTRPAVLAEVS